MTSSRSPVGERAVLLTLREWKSDTYMNTTILYDVTLSVLDRSGQVVGESRLKGEDNLGGDFVNPLRTPRPWCPRPSRPSWSSSLATPP